MKKKLKILIVIHERASNDWAALEGIANFNRDDNWILRICEIQQDIPGIIQTWKPDGLIHSDMLQTKLPSTLPRVVLFSAQPEKKRYSVGIHHRNTGKMAAKFLLNKGFKNPVFITGKMLPRSIARYEGFKQTVENSEGTPIHLESHCEHVLSPSTEQDQHIRKMAIRLATFPKPIGIYTINDDHALHILEACRLANLKIPEDVAVLGTDNSLRLCAIAHPSLSSIRLPYKQVGFEAARLLDAQLNGKKILFPQIQLDPEEIVERRSSEMLAVTDRAVVKAVTYIQAHRNELLRIPDIVRHSGISRTLLQRKFQDTLGRTPLEEIHRQKIELISDLLRNTLLTIDEIAEKCGFSDPTQLTKLFRRKTGITPSVYRKNQLPELKLK